MWIINLNYVLLLVECNNDIKIYNELNVLIQHSIAINMMNIIVQYAIKLSTIQFIVHDILYKCDVVSA